MMITGLVNQKGGVGKTTTAVNLSAGLALKGYRVLLVDMDPQHNAGKLMGITEGRYIGEALIKHNGKVIPMSEIIQSTEVDGLDVAPGSAELSSDGEALEKRVYSEGRLKQVLEPLEYDYVVIDSPPNLGRLTINVIYASDLLLIPIKADFLSIDAYRSIADLIKTIKRRLSPSQVRIFYTLYRHGSQIINQWANDDLGDSQDFVMNVRIRDLTIHGQSQVAGQSIFEYRPQSKGAKDYNEFIEEFLECQQILEK